MPRLRLYLAVVLSVLSLASQAQTVGEIQVRRTWEAQGVRFDNLFSGARASDVRQLGDSRFLLVSRPEFRPINPSPWYAVDITSDKARDLELVILTDAANDFEPGFPALRPSRPWLSEDGGVTWRRLEEARWSRNDLTGTARLALAPGTTRVAAFRPRSLEQIQAWCEGWQAHPFAKVSTLGHSAEGRPLRVVTIAETDTPRFLVLMGGQHPPEASGDRGLAWFADEFRADTPLARTFRGHFRTLVIPMVNPDGKHHGHWRGTLGGKDSNRDWIDQTLPEVQAATRYLRETCLVEGGSVAAFVDFHATNRDFFYVTSDNLPEEPSTFSSRWFARIAEENGGERPAATPSPNQAAGTSSTWARRNLKCPAYTREFAYDQEDASLRAKSRDEARALMRTLLADIGVAVER